MVSGVNLSVEYRVFWKPDASGKLPDKYDVVLPICIELRRDITSYQLFTRDDAHMDKCRRAYEKTVMGRQMDSSINKESVHGRYQHWGDYENEETEEQYNAHIGVIWYQNIKTVLDTWQPATLEELAAMPNEWDRSRASRYNQIYAERHKWAELDAQHLSHFSLSDRESAELAESLAAFAKRGFEPRWQGFVMNVVRF